MSLSGVRKILSQLELKFYFNNTCLSFFSKSVFSPSHEILNYLPLKEKSSESIKGKAHFEESRVIVREKMRDEFPLLRIEAPNRIWLVSRYLDELQNLE